jgi:hypothetical protein
MLFSSGDSSRTLSSILSGEGLDEREQEESPLLFSPPLAPKNGLTDYGLGTSRTWKNRQKALV